MSNRLHLSNELHKLYSITEKDYQWSTRLHIQYIYPRKSLLMPSSRNFLVRTRTFLVPIDIYVDATCRPLWPVVAIRQCRRHIGPNTDDIITEQEVDDFSSTFSYDD